MVFKIGLYVSLGVCALGIVYKIGRWFTLQAGLSSDEFTFIDRIISFFKGFFKLLFSWRIILVLKAIILDTFFQFRVLRVDFLRWLMHFLIFSGFILLTLMHALDEVVMLKFFPDYMSTIAPFFLLRNVFGAMVLAGVLVAIYRRFFKNKSVMFSKMNDKYAIAIVAIIIFSGFFLDSAKIISEPVYDRMVQEYAGLEEPKEIIALKQYWAKEYHVVFADLEKNPGEDVFALGKELSEGSCKDCHAPVKPLFVSYPVAKAITPIGNVVNKSRADIWLYYIHVFACFIGLAYLPFSKFFHLISDPVSLVISTSKKRFDKNANNITRRAVEFDACVNCGTCNTVCSVAPVYSILMNERILPSEKLEALKDMAYKKPLDDFDMKFISEGSFICTECNKCSDVCPVGINLQEQWISSKKLLTQLGYSSPYDWIKEKSAINWSDVVKKSKEIEARYTRSENYSTLLSNPETFDVCIQCQTCTNVCPVVASNTSDENKLDVTPQNVMNLLRMGLGDIAMGSRMTWDCITCYQCQENCPQGIKVTDILYELKNKAYNKLKMIEEMESIDDPEKINS